MNGAAFLIALALAANGDADRLLLCRPRVAGAPELARADALAEAGRALGRRLLDYGVVCEDGGEAARAARRAGLAHAIWGTAEGIPGASRYVLVLSDAEDGAERSRRSLAVAAGDDAVRPVRDALGELVRTLPVQPPEVARSHVAAWVVAGAGAVTMAAGVLLAGQARDAADRAAAATDPVAYTQARSDWESQRRSSGVALAAGGAALAAGLTWRFAF